MNEPSGNMPYYPYAGPPLTAPKRRNTLGLIALIASITGFVFSCIPGALIIGWILLPMALILGIVGVCLSGQAKGTSIAAIVTSVVGTVVGAVVFLTVVSNAFSDAFDTSDLTAAPSPAPFRPGGSTEASPGGNEAGSRNNPFPIGQTVTSPEWQIALGIPQEAGTAVAAENQFNDAPAPGMEYWIVPVRATYIGDETGNLMFGVTVKFVGSDNRTYEDRCGVIPNPLTEFGDLYNGGTAEGNACVTVPAGADGLWTVASGFGDPAFFDAN